MSLAFCIDLFFALREDLIKTIGRFSVRNCDHVDMLGRSWKTKGVVSVVWFENTEFRSELVSSYSWYFMGASQLLTPIHVIRHVMLFTSCFFFGGANPPNPKNVTTTTNFITVKEPQPLTWHTNSPPTPTSAPAAVSGFGFSAWGKLSLKEFGTLLSSLGQNPTEQELQVPWEMLVHDLLIDLFRKKRTAMVETDEIKDLCHGGILPWFTYILLSI